MKRITTVLLVWAVGLGAPCVLAEESPDAKLNPVSGAIEIADPFGAEGSQDIRHVVASGSRSDPFVVTDHPADDRRPRMTIAPDGDAYIVWWRDTATSQVLIRRHDHAGNVWSAESVLGDPALPGRDPEIVHDGTNAWVAFAEGAGPETTIRVAAIEDLPDPFGCSAEIASTTHDGEIDLRIHAESGQLWVTWIDGDVEVAWSEYDSSSATWSGVDYESYAGDDVKSALERIRAAVLGN